MVEFFRIGDYGFLIGYDLLVAINQGMYKFVPAPVRRGIQVYLRSLTLELS
jgi:hypothetical protein